MLPILCSQQSLLSFMPFLCIVYSSGLTSYHFRPICAYLQDSAGHGAEPSLALQLEQGAAHGEVRRWTWWWRNINSWSCCLAVASCLSRITQTFPSPSPVRYYYFYASFFLFFSFHLFFLSFFLLFFLVHLLGRCGTQVLWW